MTHQTAPRPRPPLDAAALERLALHYVGRYATSRARLEAYLRRKLFERGWGDEAAPDPGGVAARLAALGYVDDRALAEARGRSLARRGLGARRVADALRALGVESADTAPVLADARASAWQTALRFAERRRFGPFAVAAPDPAGRRRAFAAMARGGHHPDHIRRIVDAPIGAIPEWDGE